MGLDVIYVHVETNKSLRRNLEHAHWDMSTDGAFGVFKNVKYVGSLAFYIEHAPNQPILN